MAYYNCNCKTEECNCAVIEIDKLKAKLKKQRSDKDKINMTILRIERRGMKEQLTFRIDSELKQRVESAAKREDVSVGKWCRKALTLVVARKGKK